MSRKSIRVGILAVLVLCALILTALSGVLGPAPTRSATTASVGWIVGQVTNATSPLENVFILYVMSSGQGGPMGSAWTNSTGYYNLTVAGGVPYMVIGFNGSYYSSGGGAQPGAGETVWLNLTMAPIAPLVADVVLTGYVLDGSGGVVAGGDVIGYVNDPVTQGQGVPMYGNMTTTDPGTGRFTVNVIPGSAGGGVGGMNFPGYVFSENMTTTPFLSGHTYWINITLANPQSTDDATLAGNVTDADTGSPLENVIVSLDSQNSWNGQQGYFNYTASDSAGHYMMNVTNGTGRVTFEKQHYSSYQVESYAIGHGSHPSLDATLLAANATMRGNVTDLKTSLPLSGATVYLDDSYGHYVWTQTNSTGAYTLEAFVSSPESVMVMRNGYSTIRSPITIAPGELLWMNFALSQPDAWVTGTVTDLITGLPIANAHVQLQSVGSNVDADTNSTGGYNASLLSDNYTVTINANNYTRYSVSLEVIPGGNVLDAQLMPQNPPLTTKLYGWINGTDSGVGVNNSEIRVGLMAPYQGNEITTHTNLTGYYEVWVPPTLLQFTASANQHTHAELVVNATGLLLVRVDAMLAPDTWGPNITYSQSPRYNISWTNPSLISAQVVERDPLQIVLIHFMYMNSSSGTSDYALVQMFYHGFDPLSQSANNLPLTQNGDNYSISLSWKPIANGGWLTNGSAQQYFGSFQMNSGPFVYQGLRGMYSNKTLASPEQCTAWFDNATGDLAVISFDNRSLANALPSDTTGRLYPEVSAIRVNETNNNTRWMDRFVTGEWSVVGLKFQYDSTLPSGRYVTEFAVGDWGGRGAGNVTFITVDNDPPVANAGIDQTAPLGQVVHFDGTASTDNVGIANFTWTFEDGGSPVTLWGPDPVYTFTSMGVHNVTLEVRDGAGHNSTSVMKVTVSAAIPEFPSIIIPVSGMVLVFALVQMRRRRPDA